MIKNNTHRKRVVKLAAVPCEVTASRRLSGGGRCRGNILKIPDLGTFPTVTTRGGAT